MMASFVPKPVTINPTQGSNKGMISGSVGDDPNISSTNFTQGHGAPAQPPSLYDNSPRGIGTSDKNATSKLTFRLQYICNIFVFFDVTMYA